MEIIPAVLAAIHDLDVTHASRTRLDITAASMRVEQHAYVDSAIERLDSTADTS